MYIYKLIKQILSVNWLVSCFLNFYYLNFRKAIRFPILIGYGVKIGYLGNRRSINVSNRFGALCFALKDGPFALRGKSFWYIGDNAKIKICGTARFSKGTNLKLFANSELFIGDKFTSNANLIISCAKKIIIGDDCLIGWNVTIMDNDGGHTVKQNGRIRNAPREIVIGKHVRLSAKATVLKGSIIPDNSVVGYGSNVCGINVIEKNSVIVGNPAEVRLIGMEWNH